MQGTLELVFDVQFVTNLRFRQHSIVVDQLEVQTFQQEVQHHTGYRTTRGIRVPAVQDSSARITPPLLQTFIPRWGVLMNFAEISYLYFQLKAFVFMPLGNRSCNIRRNKHETYYCRTGSIQDEEARLGPRTTLQTSPRTSLQTSSRIHIKWSQCAVERSCNPVWVPWRIPYTRL